ncbi:DNA-directed RNA polymerase II subunit RPB1-like [Anopheles stephensi]|uniref:DNA-directed RNA polymerase II subunit RPB1-like n=1 Tax=Anopheles stephensi TaxID=30069 RepID=UPI001658C0E8|nr:DNA-directed RNA polymerase II subunit RPB1-like [Anopheles stephensi]
MKYLNFLIVLLIACANEGLSAAEESNAPVTAKTHYIPTAVSYVSFVRHIVPKRVEQSMGRPKSFNKYAPTRNSVQIDQPSMDIMSPSKTTQNLSYSNGQTEVHRERTAPYYKPGRRPTANDYHPTYPTTGTAEPIYVQSRIPLSPRPVSGTRQGNNPMVIGVQQPAYVTRYIQYGALHPSSVRKTLTYAPKLAYIPHNYQRV